MGAGVSLNAVKRKEKYDYRESNFGLTVAHPVAGECAEGCAGFSATVGRKQYVF
jgi:hypothetical protein